MINQLEGLLLIIDQLYTSLVHLIEQLLPIDNRVIYLIYKIKYFKHQRLLLSDKVKLFIQKIPYTFFIDC